MAPGTVRDEYFIGQGDATIFLRDAAGKRIEGRIVGNCPKISFKLEYDEKSHVESRTGYRFTDHKIISKPKAMVEITFESFHKENLAWLYGGAASVVAQGSATDEPQAYSPVMQLDNFNVSSVTAKKVGAGANWANTTYTVTKSGMVTILTDPPVAGVVLGDQILFNYSYGQSEKIVAATKPSREYWFSTHAFNEADLNTQVKLDFFKVVFKPGFNYDLIGEDYGSLSVEGEVLYDIAQPEATGRFFNQNKMIKV
jgi:hypothetical protein